MCTRVGVCSTWVLCLVCGRYSQKSQRSLSHTRTHTYTYTHTHTHIHAHTHTHTHTQSASCTRCVVGIFKSQHIHTYTHTHTHIHAHTHTHTHTLSASCARCVVGIFFFFFKSQRSALLNLLCDIAIAIHRMNLLVDDFIVSIEGYMIS